MNLVYVCTRISDIVAMPAMLLYLAVGIFLTFKTRFIQVRALPRLVKLLFSGVKHHKTKGEKSINPLHTEITEINQFTFMISIT